MTTATEAVETEMAEDDLPVTAVPPKAKKNKKAAKPAKAAKSAKASKSKEPASVDRSFKAGQKFEREYKGKTHTLVAVKDGDDLKFKLGSKTYGSLTQAAKAVTNYPSISGPAFWGA